MRITSDRWIGKSIAKGALKSERGLNAMTWHPLSARQRFLGGALSIAAALAGTHPFLCKLITLTKNSRLLVRVIPGQCRQIPCNVQTRKYEGVVPLNRQFDF
jgi:hypothetical protein